MNKGELTSEEILVTYYKRVGTIGRELNLIGETQFEEALKKARKCDETRKNTQNLNELGKLYGIPISIKDCFKQQGVACTCGFASRITKQLPQKNSLIIHQLIEQGAIPFVRGNTPQGLLLNETVNNIWGRAQNPWNLNKTTGGSSGGDAGLVSARCSPIAIGSDLGGSLREPALWCGVYAFKPTPNRITLQGHSLHSTLHNLLTSNTLGPIAKSTDDLILLISSFFTSSSQQLDPYTPNTTWNHNIINSIGYVKSEDFFPVSKSSRRAVEEAVSALNRVGIKTVELQLPNFKEMSLNFIEILSGSGTLENIQRACKGEPLIAEYKETQRILNLPEIIRVLLIILLNFAKEKRASEVLKTCKKKLLVQEYMYIYKEVRRNRKVMIEFWRQNNLDALITPGHVTPAVSHGLTDSLTLASSYSFIFNLLNFPTGVLPITNVQYNEDNYTEYDDPLHTGDYYFNAAARAMKFTLGLPVGIQISTLPYQDELCLKIMKILQEQIKFQQHPL